MRSRHLRLNLHQFISIGLLGATAVALGLAWNYVSTAAYPTASPIETHSASIPWLQDQATCEKTDRSWYNEQCWDDQHDPSF
ncbi:MAG: hypothetical protein KME11_19015 [Timaviella obliquedivisa GSE-PSE-MK23-08B]|nr:hypothetical protein [Timaviella obliquedivisa GSE-PSE-MK23-08B]